MYTLKDVSNNISLLNEIFQYQMLLPPVVLILLNSCLYGLIL